jgi:ferredoxin
MSNMTDTKKKIHKVVVDRKTCIGAATCIVVAPDGFELDKDNIALVKPNAEAIDDETLLMAAQSCPTGAIFLYDENNVQIFPKK